MYAQITKSLICTSGDQLASFQFYSSINNLIYALVLNMNKMIGWKNNYHKLENANAEVIPPCTQTSDLQRLLENDP